MLRISQANDRLITTIDLEGKLLGGWVPELRSAVSEALVRGDVCLNVAQLQYVDTAGAELLRELTDSKRVQLVAATPFLAALLAAAHRTASISPL